jgi:hypothetical protein
MTSSATSRSASIAQNVWRSAWRCGGPRRTPAAAVCLATMSPTAPCGDRLRDSDSGLPDAQADEQRIGRSCRSAVYHWHSASWAWARRGTVRVRPRFELEIAAKAGFIDAFTNDQEPGAKLDTLATSLCAVLVAQACNVGHKPLVDESNPALREARLRYVAPQPCQQLIELVARVATPARARSDRSMNLDQILCAGLAVQACRCSA